MAHRDVEFWRSHIVYNINVGAHRDVAAPKKCVSSRAMGVLRLKRDEEAHKELVDKQGVVAHLRYCTFTY